MWEHIKTYLKLAFMISGALALVIVLLLVCFLVMDQMSDPKDRRLSDQSLQAIGQVLRSHEPGKPGKHLQVVEETAAQAAPVAPAQPVDTLKMAEQRMLAPPSMAPGMQEPAPRSKETAQLEIEFLTDLRRSIEQNLAELKRQREELAKAQQAFKREQELENARFTELAQSTVMKLIRSLPPEQVAKDWDAQYRKAAGFPVEQGRLINDWVRMFQQLPSGTRTDIAAALEQDLRLLIMERLRATAGGAAGGGT